MERCRLYLFPQNGRNLEEKECFCGNLREEWSMYGVGELVLCVGKINGHVIRYIGGFICVPGGFGIG